MTHHAFTRALRFSTVAELRPAGPRLEPCADAARQHQHDDHAAEQREGFMRHWAAPGSSAAGAAGAAGRPKRTESAKQRRARPLRKPGGPPPSTRCSGAPKGDALHRIGSGAELALGQQRATVVDPGGDEVDVRQLARQVVEAGVKGRAVARPSCCRVPRETRSATILPSSARVIAAMGSSVRACGSRSISTASEHIDPDEAPQRALAQ